MMWLRQAMGYGEPEAPQPRISPIENNPVGWSSIYPPQVMTNPDPNVSPVVDRSTMTPQALWGALLSGNKRNVTAAELPAMEQKGNTAVDYGMAVAGATQPIRAFHGSPHTFDRFDMSRIGTGEGAQAYGHGLYFAGNEGVARSYKDALGGMKWEFSPATKAEREAVDAAKQYLADAGWDDAVGIGQALRDSDPSVASAFLKMVETGRAKSAPQGSMYEVSLRTTPERLLDWDKPLSQQPGAVREALAGLPPEIVANLRGSLPAGLAKPGGLADTKVATGERIYRELIDAQSRLQGNPTLYETPAGKVVKPSLEGASEALRDAGLDGIQYLDAGSRAAGDGTRNYVMFRDDIIDILRRYGLFGLGMMGAAGAKGGQEQ